MTKGKVYKADKVQIVYTKTIKLGKADGYSNGTKNCAAEIEIEIREVKTDYERLTVDLGPIRPYHELSICGVIWNHIRTDWVSGGQNCEDLLAYFPDDPKVAEIVKVWDRWHLNAMNAGTRRQEAYLKQHEPDWEAYQQKCRNEHTYASHYDWACTILGAYVPLGQTDNLYEDRDYKYGHAWLVEPLPQEIIKQVKTW